MTGTDTSEMYEVIERVLEWHAGTESHPPRWAYRHVSCGCYGSLEDAMCHAGKRRDRYWFHSQKAREWHSKAGDLLIRAVGKVAG